MSKEKMTPLFFQDDEEEMIEKKCPRCGDSDRPLLALSRRANKSICSKCGTEEAVFDFKINQSRNMVGADAFKEEIDQAVAKEKAWSKKERI